MSRHQWRQLLELALVLFLLNIWISNQLCFAQIVEIRINWLSVLFPWEKFTFFFFEEVVRAYANFLNHLDCSHGVRQYFMIKFSCKKQNFLQKWRQWLELTLELFLDYLDFRIFMFGLNSWNQDEFTASFILRPKFIFLFFFSRKLLKFWAYLDSLNHFILQSWCTCSNL